MSHRSELDKDAVRNVVTAAGVGEQLVEKIAMLVAVPEMMVWIDDLERRLQNFFFALRPPGGIAVARSGREISGDGRNGRGVALGVRRGSLKACPTQHSRRCDQHGAARYRMHGEPSSQPSLSLPSFFLEPPVFAAGRYHSTAASPNGHRFSIGEIRSGAGRDHTRPLRSASQDFTWS